MLNPYEWHSVIPLFVFMRRHSVWCWKISIEKEGMCWEMFWVTCTMKQYRRFGTTIVFNQTILFISDFQYHLQISAWICNYIYILCPLYKTWCILWYVSFTYHASLCLPGCICISVFPTWWVSRFSRQLKWSKNCWIHISITTTATTTTTTVPTSAAISWTCKCCHHVIWHITNICPN